MPVVPWDGSNLRAGGRPLSLVRELSFVSQSDVGEGEEIIARHQARGRFGGVVLSVLAGYRCFSGERPSVNGPDLRTGIVGTAMKSSSEGKRELLDWALEINNWAPSSC